MPLGGGIAPRSRTEGVAITSKMDLLRYPPLQTKPDEDADSFGRPVARALEWRLAHAQKNDRPSREGQGESVEIEEKQNRKWW